MTILLTILALLAGCTTILIIEFIRYVQDNNKQWEDYLRQHNLMK